MSTKDEARGPGLSLPKRPSTLIGIGTSSFHRVSPDEEVTPVSNKLPPPPRKRRLEDPDPVPISRKKRRSITMPSSLIPSSVHDDAVVSLDAIKPSARTSSLPAPPELAHAVTPPPPPVTPASVAHLPSAQRRITAPVMAAVRGLPDDHELKAAQHALDKVSELDRLRETLLALPDWVPVSQPMMAICREIRRFRQIAAQLLHVSAAELED